MLYHLRDSGFKGVIIEYCSVAYHPMLNKGQESNLERLHWLAVKVCVGFDIPTDGPLIKSMSQYPVVDRDPDARGVFLWFFFFFRFVFRLRAATCRLDVTACNARRVVVVFFSFDCIVLTRCPGGRKENTWAKYSAGGARGKSRGKNFIEKP